MSCVSTVANASVVILSRHCERGQQSLVGHAMEVPVTVADGGNISRNGTRAGIKVALATHVGNSPLGRLEHHRIEQFFFSFLTAILLLPFMNRRRFCQWHG